MDCPPLSGPVAWSSSDRAQLQTLVQREHHSPVEPPGNPKVIREVTKIYIYISFKAPTLSSWQASPFLRHCVPVIPSLPLSLLCQHTRAASSPNSTQQSRCHSSLRLAPPWAPLSGEREHDTRQRTAPGLCSSPSRPFHTPSNAAVLRGTPPVRFSPTVSSVPSDTASASELRSVRANTLSDAAPTGFLTQLIHLPLLSHNSASLEDVPPFCVSFYSPTLPSDDGC